MKAMKYSRCLLAPVFLLGLASCAEMTGWSPTVDAANDPNANRLSSDMAQCHALAEHAADIGKTMVVDTGVGMVGGAAGGAAIGAVVGAPAPGAAIGAAAGTGAGLVGGGTTADVTYKRAYSRCLKERGHPVLD